MKAKSVYKIDVVKEDNWEYRVGYNCRQIEYHEPTGGGRDHYCDVTRHDGDLVRIFNPDAVVLPEVPKSSQAIPVDQLLALWEEAKRTSPTSTNAFCMFAEAVLNLTEEVTK